jgi:hypothetical protein
MKIGGRFLVVATLAAAWAGIAHGGAFNACHVTYDYDGTLLINGERFFPVGNYFLPQGYPENQGIPNINEAYEAFAANGGNTLIHPRYSHMLSSEPDPYGVHGCPSDLYYGETECTDHLNAAYPQAVKLMAGSHIFWWWDAEYRNEEYPGPHPLCGWVSGTYGWPIEQPTQEERFSGLPPSGGIKGWVENGASGAFMGWNHWGEGAWCFWQHKFLEPGPYPEPPMPVPSAGDVQRTYDWLRALEDNPAVDADHPTFTFDPPIVRLVDLWPMYYAATEIAGVNTIPVPEPYISKFRDTEPFSWCKNGMLPNYSCALGGDVMDVFFEIVNAEKPVICVVQNHDGKIIIGNEEKYIPPTAGQSRFMTYDGIIHRANGILYGGQSFGSLEEAYWNIFEQFWDPCKPTFNEIGQGGVMHEVLKGEYDNLLVEVITKQQGVEVERSAFIGGELAPKNHFLSANILMESCVKKYGGFTYLIAACRVGIDQLNPVTPPPYAVTFRPYFSTKTTWTGAVEVVGEEGTGGEPRTINIVNGAFADEFDPEEVHIYKFQRPSPYVPD